MKVTDCPVTEVPLGDFETIAVVVLAWETSNAALVWLVTPPPDENAVKV